MNKIYKLVWSKVRNAWVVASEIAKGHGKNASVTRERKLLKTAVITAIMGGCLMTGGLASAATNPAGTGPGIAIGQDSHADNATGISIGKNAKTNKSGAMDAIAIGHDAEASNGSIVIGGNAKDHEGDNGSTYGVIIGNGAHSLGGGTAQVILGAQANAKGSEAMAFGSDAKADGEKSITIGSISAAEGDFATALGGQAKAIGESATAVGFSAKALAKNAVALGYNAQSTKTSSLALGHHSIAETEYGVSLGSWSKADREAGIVGYLAGAQETNEWKSSVAAVAVGNKEEGYTRQITGVAAGSENTDAVNVAQLKALNNKVDKGAIHYVSVNPLKKEQTAGSNYENDGAKGDGGIAIGEAATSQGRGIAMGYKSKAVPKTGATVNPNAFEGIAIGQEADMEVPGGIAIGIRSKVEGTLNTQGGNVNELGTIALGTDSHAKGNGAAAFGWKAKGIGEGAMAFGTETEAKESGTAFGAHATVAAGGVAMGWQAHANDRVATSVGTSSDAAKQATAVGAGTTADGIASTAVGLGAVSKGVLSTAIGAQSVAEKSGSVALGADSVANRQAGEIGYIATGSSATFEEALVTLNKKEDYDKWTAKVNESKSEYDNLTKAFEDARTKDKKAEAKAALDAWKGQHADFIEALTAKEKLEATWRATKAAVSVGADGMDAAGNRIIESRQITNVAAGTRDTDAVNVAQLKAVNTKVEGNKIHYLSIGPDNEKNLAKDGNYNNDGADSHWGIAIGVNASSKGGGSIAIGKGSQAHGTEEHRAQGVSIGSASRAIGAFATAVGHDTKAFGERSVAYGLGEAYGRGSIAIGSGAVAALKEGITKEEYNKLSDEEKAWYGKADYDDQKTFYQFRKKGKDGKAEDIKNYGMAIGSGATSFDNAGLAVGLNAKTNKDFGVAIGGYSENKVEQGVALGTSSVADRAKDVKGYLPTTGKAIENFEEAMKATGKEAAFKELKGKYLAAQEKLAKAQEAYNADQSPTNMMNLDKAQKELKGLTEEYAVMTAPWTSRRGAVSVGNDKTGFTRQITGVAAGSEDTDAVNVAQLKALNDKVDKSGVHYLSVNSDDTANPAGTNWNNDGATGKDAVAIGKNAAAAGESAFATGWKSKAAGYSDIAIGREAEATGGWGVAIGQAAKAKASTAVAMAFAAEAKGANSLAIGVQSEARTNDSSAYGRGAKALGQVALAVGTLTKAEGNHSSVFGFKATTDSTAWNGTAIGRGAYIGKQAPDGTTPDIGVSDNYYMPVDDDTAVEAGKETKNSTAVGFGAKSFGYQNTAVGAGAEAFDTNTVAVGVMSKAIGHYANALGKQARAEGKDSIAIGHFARAIGESSTALGDYAITSTLDGKKGVSKSVAVGSHARAASDNSIALGNNSLANIADDVKTEAYLSKETFKKENGVVSVGNKEYTVGNEKIEQNYRRITNVAGGADDHDAVNVAQLKALNDKVDKSGVHYFSVNANESAKPEGTNWNNDGAKGVSAIAVGPHALAQGNYSTVVGPYAQAVAKESSVFGVGANASGVAATAAGAKAKAMGIASTATGSNAVANGKTASAFGAAANATGVATTALGVSAQAKSNESVAVGAYSVADREKGKIGYALGGDNSTLEKALESAGQKAKYDELTGKIAPLADEYNGLLKAYLDAPRDSAEGKTAKEKLDEWEAGHPDFLSAVKEKQQMTDAWQSGNGAVSVGKAGATRQITNVAAGSEDTDAVNVAQLKVVNEKADKNATDITNLTKTVNANGKATKVTVDGEENKTNGNLKITKETKDGQTTYNLSLNDELTLGKDGKDGKIGINGKDGKSAEITVGKGEPGVDGTNGKDGITRIIYKDEKGNHHEVATLDDGLKFKGDNADVVIRKLNTQLNITGGAKAADLSDDNIGVVGTAGDNGGLAVKLSKKLKGLTSAEFVDGDNITNITAGDVTVTRKEGNVSLWELNQTVNNITQGTTDVSSWKLQANGENERIIKKDSVVNFKNGENTEVIVNGNDITVDLNAATKKQINDNTTNISNIDKRVTTIENNIDQKIEGAKITVKGDDKTGVKAEEVKTGDKVTGYKVSLEKKVKVGNVTIDGTGEGTDKKGEITGLTNRTLDSDDFATKGRAATEEQLKAAMGKVQAQSRTTVKGSENITVTPKTESASEYTVELAKNINVDSVTAKTVKADEYKVGEKTYINDEGINANGNKITNVGKGEISEKSTDAVNGSQLYSVEQKVTKNITDLQTNIYDMGMKVGELDTRVNKVGAGAAALAALHPLDFDPDAKWDFAAGYGNYKGANAAAVGAYYRPNEDTMISVGGSFGGGENMVNAGIAVKLGQGNHVTNSKVAMAKEMLAMQERMAQMEAQMAKMQGFIGALTGMESASSAMFPDVPENHWAYEYVKGLCEQGVIEGYPDGMFSGNRNLTRYEMAAMLYRALAKGVQLDARAVKEFASELGRIRVDVISQDKEGQPVIERVRVNKK